PRLAYLLAASHSGSTLLTMLLGAQAGACTVGELKATSLGDPEQYRCSCKARIRDCEFWKDLRTAMAERGVPEFDITNAQTSIFEVQSSYARRLLAPLHRSPALETIRDTALTLSPSWRTHLRESNRRNLALIQSVLAITGAEVVVDSSKVALRLKYLLQIPALDVRVIRVIRDGRAVSLTYMDDWTFADSSDPALRGGGSGTKRPPPRRSMAEAAHEWKRSNEASDSLVARLPRSQWTEIRYEELCAEPEATLRRLCQFLDLDPESVRLDFRSREQHVIGNGMRMDSTSEIRLDERWKSNLSSEDLSVFDDVAGELNRKYGYR
ncbi:MAG: sulfotransferase, partial [Chthoniobacteraceae bacterium]